MKNPKALLAGAAVGISALLWATPAGAVPSGGSYVHDCGQSTAPGYARCYALHRTDVVRSKTSAATPAGYGPADLQSAYNLPGSGGDGQTVAIVDAYDDPNAEADLASYRATYGLPECSTANGCFSKVDQNGGSSLPAPDAGWAGEISLDLDMVSATCPGCHVLLVEADSASFADLGTAENTTAAGADVVSNSYGGSDARDSTYAKYYRHDGVAITASTGDSNYEGASYPASSSYVIAVGGTSLTTSSASRGWSESVWSDANGGTGSGCSSYNAAIPGAASFYTGCAGRAMADVSAVADPQTGVAVYDTYQAGGWEVYGGTSASAPIVAGVIGMAGNASSVTPSTPYASPEALNDVTSGGNGSCSPSQLCTARGGWDGPTGLGSPNGTSAF